MQSCKPLDPCVRNDELEVVVGDTIFVKTCSMNAEIYRWTLDKEEINRFLYPPEPFFNHYVDIGGGSCDGFIRLYIYDTGSYTLSIDIAKLGNGIRCASDPEFPLSKSESKSVQIHVVDRIKKSRI